MNKQLVNNIKITAFLFSALLINFLTSCSTLSSGKKYTLAKVNRDRQLIEPHRVIAEPNQLDMLDQVNPTNVLGIILNSGYLPYLQEVGRPEVAIFVTTKIRAKNQPEAVLLWERVYLNSEADDTYIALNKDSFFPRMDIPVLPPIIYNDEEITVNIRIIEMDQDDNKRMKEIIAVAASAAATFQPQYAGAISIFQNVLNFIISNNADDIEFQFDFALSQLPGPIVYKTSRGNERYDMILNPRVNKYALIKTEHRDRQIMPFGYADNAQNGLRYGAAEILKFGTLGILNWSMWCDLIFPCNYMDLKEQDDIYHKLLGRPFTTQRNSFIPPTFEQGLLSPPLGEQPGTFEVVGDNIKVNNEGEVFDYEAQGFLIFSVVADVKGVDVGTMQAIANQNQLIKNLNLNTRQLGPEDFKKQLQPIQKSIEGFIAERNIREECTELINTAETEEQLKKEQAACKKRVNEVKVQFNSSDTMRIGLDNTQREISSLAGRQSERLIKQGKALIPIKSTKIGTGTDIHLETLIQSQTFSNPATLTLSGTYWSEDAAGTNKTPTSLPAFQFLETNFDRIAKTDIKSLSAGNYETEITFNTSPPIRQRHKFCTSLKPIIAKLELTGHTTLPTKFEKQAELIIKGANFECVTEVSITDAAGELMKFAIKPKNKSEATLVNSSDQEITWKKVILHTENEESVAKNI